MQQRKDDEVHVRSIQANMILLMKRTRKRYTMHDLLQKVEVKRDARAALETMLRKHGMVKFDGNMYSYKPFLEDVVDRDSLVHYIETHRQGTLRDLILDAYAGAEAHLAELEKSGRVIQLEKKDEKPPKEVVYPADSMQLPEATPDERKGIRELWKSIDMPKDITKVEDLLAGQGHTESREAVRKVTGKKKRARSNTRRQKAGGFRTNTHMEGVDDEPPH